MTIAATAVKTAKTYKSWTVTCADADTSGSFAHGFGATPDCVILTPAVSAASLTNWSATVDGTTLYLVKLSATGSGGTTPGTTIALKVVVMLPHSILSS